MALVMPASQRQQQTTAERRVAEVTAARKQQQAQEEPCTSASLSASSACFDAWCLCASTTTRHEDVGEVKLSSSSCLSSLGELEEEEKVSRRTSTFPYFSPTSSSFLSLLLSSLRYARSTDALRPVSLPSLRVLAILMNLLLTFGTANGYVVGRLLTLQQNDIPTEQKYLFSSSQPYHHSSFSSPSLYKKNSLHSVDESSPTKTLAYASFMPKMTFYRMFQDEKRIRKRRTASAAEGANSARPNRKYKRHILPRNYVLRLDDSQSNDKREGTRAEFLRNYPRLHVKRTANNAQKKSALKSLKKFSSNGARNCFFTPIQCMIQHDMSKYKKLIENNSDRFTTIKMR